MQHKRGIVTGNEAVATPNLHLLQRLAGLQVRLTAHSLSPLSVSEGVACKARPYMGLQKRESKSKREHRHKLPTVRLRQYHIQLQEKEWGSMSQPYLGALLWVIIEGC